MGVTKILADYSGFAAGKEGRTVGAKGTIVRASERASEHAHNMPFLVTWSGREGGKEVLGP